jgi:chromosome segregation ATPase
MNERELYRRKQQAQLEEWRADLDKLKARAAREDAEAQLSLSEQVKTLEVRIEEQQAKLSRLAEASDDAWESVKEGMETGWDSVKSAFSDAAAKFKN